MSRREVGKRGKRREGVSPFIPAKYRRNSMRGGGMRRERREMESCATGREIRQSTFFAGKTKFEGIVQRKKKFSRTLSICGRANAAADPIARYTCRFCGGLSGEIRSNRKAALLPTLPFLAQRGCSRKFQEAPCLLPPCGGGGLAFLGRGPKTFSGPYGERGNPFFNRTPRRYWNTLFCH